MNKIFFILLLLVLVAFLSQQVNAQPNNQTVFITTSWLAEHINDPSIVVLHVAPIHRDYLNGHIPGARFLWSGARGFAVNASSKTGFN